jgi:Tfp pilus assembly protein PilV
MDDWNKFHNSGFTQHHFFNKKKSGAGFTLVGVLVALLLLVGGAVAIGQLIVRTERAAAIARERFVATHLAREGVELVRAIRDTNWLTPGQSWTKNICTPGGEESFSGQHSFLIDPSSVRDLMKGGPELSEANSSHPNEGQLFVIPFTATRSRGEWTHRLGQQQESTPFRRVITVDCSQKDDNLTDPAHPQGGRIDLTSQVFWEDRGQPRSLAVTEHLYNWLPKNL